MDGPSPLRSHTDPDLFAGVMPMSGNPEYFSRLYADARPFGDRAVL